ncbi:hypothetical protein D3C72_898650 [compost metagenome]
MIGLAIHLETPLAQGRVTGVFPRAVAIDQHLVETGFETAGGLFPAHELGGGAGAHGIGALAGHVGGEIAAPLRHDAEAAEGEHLEADVGLAGQLPDLMHGEHPRQHHPADVEVLLVEADGGGVGGAGLHRDMELHVGMMAAGVIQHGEIGDDQGIGTERHPSVHRLLPSGIRARVGEGVDGDVQLAAVPVHIVHRSFQLAVREVESGEVAGVGVILEADIDRIGPVIHGCLQCRQAACRAE